MKRYQSALSVGFLGLVCLLVGGPGGVNDRLYGYWEAPLPLATACPQACPVGCPAPPPVVVMPVEPIVPPSPVVKLRLRAPACGVGSEDLEYRICVENCSAADAHHVVV